MDLNEEEKNQITNEIIKNEVKYLREKWIKEWIIDYFPLTIIGRGAFGEVRLCKHVVTNEIVAVKKMNKLEMHWKN